MKRGPEGLKVIQLGPKVPPVKRILPPVLTDRPHGAKTFLSGPPNERSGDIARPFLDDPHPEPGERVSHVAPAVSPDIDPNVIELAWRSVTSDSPIATVDLLYLTKEHWLQCLGCGRHHQGGTRSVCPSCGDSGLIVYPARKVPRAGWVAEETA